MTGLFITATDTGVGKTWVTAALAGALRQRGHDIGIWKPVQSGSLPGDPGGDGEELKRVSGIADSADTIAPLRFRAPLTPSLAALLEGTALTIDTILEAGRPVRAAHRSLLVEGAGGLAVPITRDALLVHLAQRLALPLLIVARPGLGTINHCLLTVAYARSHGLPVAGILFNRYRSPMPPQTKSLHEFADSAELRSEATNPMLVHHFGTVPILGRIPELPADAPPARRIDTIARHADLDAIARAALPHAAP